MKGFNKCDKGHFYKDTDECPYCPKVGTSKKEDPKTEFVGTKKDIPTDKTQVFGGATESTSANVKDTSSQGSFDPTKTMIVGDSSTDSTNTPNNTSRRKLRGWLVSFDIEKFGIDYRIVEGRNTIGSKSSNDVSVKDSQVSGMHALILCKKDKLIITDELSSNGTLLNGEDLNPREPFSLNDGDEIRIGTTNFLFKTAFKK